MRRNGRGVRCSGKTVDRQAHLRVCVREREIGRKGLAPLDSSPMQLPLHSLAQKGCALVLDLCFGMGFITILVLKVRMK